MKRMSVNKGEESAWSEGVQRAGEPSGSGVPDDQCCLCVCVRVHYDVYVDMRVCGVHEHVQSVCVSHDTTRLDTTQHTTVQHSTVQPIAA